MSAIFTVAAELERQMTEDYRAELERRYQLAEQATHGYLVNKAGKTHHIEAFTLFSGTETRAYRYASPELVKHWEETGGRLSRAHFEALWLRSRGEELAIIGGYA